MLWSHLRSGRIWVRACVGSEPAGQQWFGKKSPAHGAHNEPILRVFISVDDILFFLLSVEDVVHPVGATRGERSNQQSLVVVAFFPSPIDARLRLCFNPWLDSRRVHLGRFCCARTVTNDQLSLA